MRTIWKHELHFIVFFAQSGYSEIITYVLNRYVYHIRHHILCT